MTGAIQAVLALLRQGHTDVVDADLSKYFDTIPHSELMQSIARRIVDRDMLGLIKQWLNAPVETTDGNGKRRIEGGKANKLGTPQGGVISPQVANLYMNRFLKHWRQSGKGEAWQAWIINYADDFVILSRGHAAEALAWTDRVMMRLGLSLNRSKTCLRDARTAADRPMVHRRQYVEEKRATSEGEGECVLVPGNKGTWEEVRDTLNRLFAGMGQLLQPRFSAHVPKPRRHLVSLP